MAIATVVVLLGIIGAILYLGHTTKPWWEGTQDKKLWDYLELLIVPAALALGVTWLNWEQSRREREAEQAQHKRDLEVENQRAQSDALQAYLDAMDRLLRDVSLTESSDQSTSFINRELAQARTIAVIATLGAERNRIVTRFLRNLRLTQSPSAILRDADLTAAELAGSLLEGADLSEANLREANLREANLSEANLSVATLFRADLSGADLSGADLSVAAILREADLNEANLRGANLSSAILNQANLRGANLRGANLRTASLVGADLSGADLSDADLSVAILREADLSEANLSDVNGLMELQLGAAGSLEGAIMPNGQKYEDWVKDKESRKEDGG